MTKREATISSTSDFFFSFRKWTWFALIFVAGTRCDHESWLEYIKYGKYVKSCGVLDYSYDDTSELENFWTKLN